MQLALKSIENKYETQIINNLKSNIMEFLVILTVVSLSVLGLHTLLKKISKSYKDMYNDVKIGDY